MGDRRPPPARVSLANRLRHALGLRQTLFVAGVRYREVSGESLRHALSRKGRGYKEYDASFADGTVMRIRCTLERDFEDLGGPRRLALYQRAEQLLRPGMRVVVLAAGTGYASRWIADRVAPSGAVVAIDSDRESIEFARRRYPIANTSFEVGGLENTAGETDEGFHAAVWVAPRIGDDPSPTLNELWRLITRDGWLMLAAPGLDAARLIEAAAEICVKQHGGALSLVDRGDAWTTLVIRKPAPD